MVSQLLHEQPALWCAVFGLILGFALGICCAKCFARLPAGQQPRPRRAASTVKGELKMVLLVRTDLGMQKGASAESFCDLSRNERGQVEAARLNKFK